MALLALSTRARACCFERPTRLASRVGETGFQCRKEGKAFGGLGCRNIRSPGAQWNCSPSARPRSLIPKATGLVAPGAGWILASIAAIVGFCLSVFLIAAVPTLLAMRVAALKTAAVMAKLEAEMPETAAVMRLSGLELSDAIQEVTLLSQDVTAGVQSSARAITAAEQGVRQRASWVQAAVTQLLIPEVKSRAPAVRDAIQAAVRIRAQRSAAQPDLKEVLQAISASKRMVQRTRAILMAARVVNHGRQMRRLLPRHQAIQSYPDSSSNLDRSI